MCGAPAPGGGGAPEHLVRLMTHVCCQQLSGVFSSVASLSRGCWRGCGVAGDAQPGRVVAWSPRKEQSSCRWQGPPPRWRDGRCLCQHGGGIEGRLYSPPPPPQPPPPHPPHPPHHPHPSNATTCRTATTTTTAAAAAATTTTTTTTTTNTTTTTTTTTTTALPPQHSLLAVLLLLVATLARFTEGCSSRSTPKPRPPSPTLRPNITFQTYACPPAYAAWYCLNGATCFTVKIGESILYNCECADGYMGQRCEFKDLDGSYLPAREKVLLETASIAGGATVACVLVFVVLFAIYVFMQKDKDKHCRDLSDGRENDRQPFSGYQNPRPEIIRTISNPYARTIEELSHIEVQPTKPIAKPESSGNVDSNSDLCTTNINNSQRSGNMENSSNSCATNTQTNVRNAQDPS